MTEPVTIGTCWAPECAVTFEQNPAGRAKLYCSPTCRQRAFRRAGGKAPTTPFPPFPPTPLHQDAPAATVGTGSEQQTLRPRGSAPGPSGSGSSDAEVLGQQPLRKLAGNVTPPPVAAGGTATAPLQPPQGAAGSTPRAAAAPTELTVTIPVDSVLPPVPLVEHQMVLAYKADLAAMGQLDSRQGHKIVAMAEKLVSSATTATAAANLSKELDRLMDDLSKATAGQAAQDGFSVIRQRTLHKLGLVGAR